MHVRELVELAASIASDADSLLAGPTGISDDGIDTYWIASKERLDRWNSMLSAVTNAHANDRSATQDGPVETASDPTVPSESPLAEMRPLAEEVLGAEILTRVWAAVLTRATHLPTHHTTAAVGKSVFIGHQEVRFGVLNWLVNSPVSQTPAGNELNLFRRRCERWTDLLLGRIQMVADVAPFGFDPARVREYCSDFNSERRAGTFDVSWQQMGISLRNLFDSGVSTVSPSRQMNADIGAAVLASLGPEVLEAWGSYRWAWLHRVDRMASDAERLVAELLVMEVPKASR